LEGDAGPLATRTYHALTTSLAVAAPVYMLIPDSYGDAAFNKMFGVFLSGNVTAHAWIGLNYVIRDYVPKISKQLLGPARIVNAGVCVFLFLGMSKIAVFSPGGIKAVVKGVWNGKPEKDLNDF
jgi:succinate dehydrogenase hydrophobic anchor subunit